MSKRIIKKIPTSIRIFFKKLRFIIVGLFFFILSNIIFFGITYIRLKTLNHNKLEYILQILKQENIDLENKKNQLIYIHDFYNKLFNNLNELTIRVNEEIILKYQNKNPYKGFSTRIKNHYDYNQNKIVLENEYIIKYRDIYIFELINFFIILLIYFFYFKNIKQIIKVEEKRQADFYLLKQLFEPFQNLELSSKNIFIEYYLEQYVKFNHKNHSFDLGGDYIYFCSIYLRKRKYIFFINADSMGKSLQGFVGTLILSTVLSAIIKRTKKRIIEKERYPETWLKYTALEIHEVFQTFLGFMMISAVIGLIDEENGLLYMMNFDHPLPIYINSNSYHFLNSKVHRKLGFPSSNIFMEIFRYPLSQNDIIIIGSDGKDEVLIEERNTINEDEYLSLNLLKEAEGNLSIFVQKLKNNYTLTDDLSLLKLVYKSKPNLAFINVEQEITHYNINQFIVDLNKSLFQLLKNKEYQKIIELFKEMIQVYPVNDELLYWYSYSCRKRKLYLEAIEIGERLLNFNKNHIKNYLQLIYCYKKINHQFRIDILIEELNEIINKPIKVYKIKKLLKIQ